MRGKGKPRTGGAQLCGVISLECRAVAADSGATPHLCGLHICRLMLCATLIDDWGPEPLTAEQRRDLLEIVDDRYDKGSLLITSQVPVAQWFEVIADPT